MAKKSFRSKSPKPTELEMTVMTKEETEMIAGSWDLVAQDLPGHSVKFFKQ